MKKLLAIVVLGLLLSSNAYAKVNEINKLLNDGYKIIKEDIVSREDSTRFIKVFTLQNRKSSLIICNVSFDSGGRFDDVYCIKP